MKMQKVRSCTTVRVIKSQGGNDPDISLVRIKNSLELTLLLARFAQPVVV